MSTMLNSSDLPAAACEGPLCSCTGVTGLGFCLLLINLKKGRGDMAELHRTQFCTIDYSLITLSSQDDPEAEADVPDCCDPQDGWLSAFQSLQGSTGNSALGLQIDANSSLSSLT